MSDTKIKILFISSWFQNRTKPVFSQFIHRHAKAAALYTSVTFLHVCFEKNKNKNRYEIVENTIDGVNVVYVYIKRPHIILFKLFMYLNGYKRGWDFVSKKFGSQDIVHANVLFPVGLVFIFLKSYKKIPFIFTEHWSGFLPDNKNKIGYIKKYLIKKIARQASLIMPVSENLKKAMEESEIQGNYMVIPNVVDTNVFTEFSKDKSFNNLNKKILHVSSLQDESKNISGILNVIKKLSFQRNDFSLHIVSYGNQKPFIEKAERLSLLNKSVFFEKGKNPEELAEIMHQSDFLLLFSNYETFSCNIIESLSCNLPVIATDVGDISKIVSEKFGILVNPKDEESLLTAIEYILDHPDNFDRKNMHEFIEKNFSYQVVGKRFYDIYLKVLKIKSINNNTTTG